MTTDHTTSADGDKPFGASISPPHRPQPLGAAVSGEEAFAGVGEKTPSVLSEAPNSTERTGTPADWIESETGRLGSRASGARTSTFIFGEGG